MFYYPTEGNPYFWKLNYTFLNIKRKSYSLHWAALITSLFYSSQGGNKLNLLVVTFSSWVETQSVALLPAATASCLRRLHQTPREEAPKALGKCRIFRGKTETGEHLLNQWHQDACTQGLWSQIQLLKKQVNKQTPHPPHLNFPMQFWVFTKGKGSSSLLVARTSTRQTGSAKGCFLQQGPNRPQTYIHIWMKYPNPNHLPEFQLDFKDRIPLPSGRGGDSPHLIKEIWPSDRGLNLFFFLSPLPPLPSLPPQGPNFWNHDFY